MLSKLWFSMNRTTTCLTGTVWLIPGAAAEGAASTAGAVACVATRPVAAHGVVVVANGSAMGYSSLRSPTRPPLPFTTAARDGIDRLDTP